MPRIEPSTFLTCRSPFLTLQSLDDLAKPSLRFARVAELADALDLGSSGQPWGFESPLSHHSNDCGLHRSFSAQRRTSQPRPIRAARKGRSGFFDNP